MVDITSIVNGVYKPTNITGGGHHLVHIYISVSEYSRDGAKNIVAPTKLNGIG